VDLRNSGPLEKWAGTFFWRHLPKASLRDFSSNLLQDRCCPVAPSNSVRAVNTECLLYNTTVTNVYLRSIAKTRSISASRPITTNTPMKHYQNVGLLHIKQHKAS